MKVKIDIELWDETSAEKLESVGATDKLVVIMYENAFKEILEEICVEGMEYSLNVEVEDNTKK